MVRLAVLLLVIGCGGSERVTPLPDGPVIPDSMIADSMIADSMIEPDSLVPDSMIDAGIDAAIDAQAIDAQAIDAQAIDASTIDATPIDAPTIDAMPIDAMPIDSPPIDSPPIDSPPIDSPPIDSPPIDSPPPIDASIPDGGIPACAPNTWCVETSPVAGKFLHAVWAVTANDVFVVGDTGTILRRTNNAWSQLASPSTKDLHGVWAASSTDAWAVGEGGTVLHWNGTTWSAISGFTTDFNAVWGSSANDVWIAGFGIVQHWDGQAFTSKTLAGELFAIGGTGPNDVWVTGENAKVDHFTGTWTTGIDPGTGNTYFSIHPISTTNVFVGGFVPPKETLQFNGVTWTPRPATGCVFVGMFSTSATNLWATGGTKVGHWNGTAWSIDTPAGASVQLLGISGAGAHVWVVGSDSLILHRN